MQQNETRVGPRRHISNILSRALCHEHNAGVGRRWPNGTEDTMFRVAEADLSKVQVEVRQPRKFQRSE